VAGLFLLSATALALEISLTRLFSFLFVQSYVYILISCSMAGVGFGAVLMYFVPDHNRARITGWILTLPAVMLTILYATNSVRSMLVPSLLVTFMIFAAVGAMQLMVFRESGIRIASLYAADLTGAALGSLLSFFLLNALGALNALVLVITLMSVTLLTLHRALFARRGRTIPALAVIVVAATTSLFLSLQDTMHPTETWLKEMTVMLNDPARNARIAERRWSAFGRVDVIETDNPLFKTMFIDGAAGTRIVRMDEGRIPPATAEVLLFQYMGGVPLLAVEESRRNTAAIIGSGGGIDVATLLAARYRHIDAVEINPDFIEVVRSQPEYTGGIYNDHPRVTVHQQEGRSFLRTTGTRYDLILMGLPIIKSVRNFGNHALTENYLFTSDAFREYRAALGPDGMMIVIAHYRNELRKLVSNAVHSFHRDGYSTREAMDHIITIGTDANPTMILNREPFTMEQRVHFATILRNLPVQGSTNFIPGATSAAVEEFGLNRELVALGTGDMTLAQFIAGADENIAWITDDSPFFYQMSASLPMELLAVGGLVVALMVGMTALFLVVRRGRLRAIDTSKSRVEAPATRAIWLKYAAFGCIGFGFMLVEIGILQQFIVFWQHQTPALAIVLAAILVSSGLGSVLARRISDPRIVIATTAMIVALVLIARWRLGDLLMEWESASISVKALVTVACTIPLFLPMGIPFPFLLATVDRELYPWMMGFNSVTTLGGGVLSMIVAIHAGFSTVMIAGAAAYLGFLTLTFTCSRLRCDRADRIMVRSA
jgi:predicted membrane-bound spermidine synthase